LIQEEANKFWSVSKFRINVLQLVWKSKSKWRIIS